MDHVLEGMQPHYDVLLEWFIEEHKKGQYKKLSDNPYYDEVKALIDAMNILRKYLGWDSIKLSEEVSWRLEG
jgi:hypothetical protein